MTQYIVRESVKTNDPAEQGYPVATFDNYIDACSFIEQSENRKNLYISLKEI